MSEQRTVDKLICQFAIWSKERFNTINSLSPDEWRGVVDHIRTLEASHKADQERIASLEAQLAVSQQAVKDASREYDVQADNMEGLRQAKNEMCAKVHDLEQKLTQRATPLRDAVCEDFIEELNRIVKRYGGYVPYCDEVKQLLRRGKP